MSEILKKQSRFVADFVRQESQKEETMGILVFGSYLTGKIRKTSDIDILVLTGGKKSYAIERRVVNGLPIEIHKQSIEFFCSPFLGRIRSIFLDAFSFAVMRKSRILYDPNGNLKEFKQYSQTHRLPISHISAFMRSAMRRIKTATHLLREKNTEGSEIEIRCASEDITRAFLLEIDIPEINPPKIYLPQLRTNFQSFHSLFVKIHNLEEIRRNDVKMTILKCCNWLKIIESTASIVRIKEILQCARSELANAEDCLHSGDLEASIMQSRYSALISMPLAFTYQSTARNDIRNASLSRQYLKLDEIERPRIKQMFRDIMNFLSDRKILKDHIEVLRNIMEIRNLP